MDYVPVRALAVYCTIVYTPKRVDGMHGDSLPAKQLSEVGGTLPERLPKQLLRHVPS